MMVDFVLVCLLVLAFLLVRKEEKLISRRKSRKSEDLLKELLSKRSCPCCKTARLLLHFDREPTTGLWACYSVCRWCSQSFRVYLWDEEVLEKELDKVFVTEGRKFDRCVMAEIEGA